MALLTSPPYTEPSRRLATRVGHSTRIVHRQARVSDVDQVLLELGIQIRPGIPGWMRGDSPDVGVTLERYKGALTYGLRIPKILRCSEDPGIWYEMV